MYAFLQKFIYFRVNRSEKGGEKSGSGINDYVTSLFDQALTWKDISWLKNITNLPIIVKGVLHPQDAVIAMEYGVQGKVQIFYESPKTILLRDVKKIGRYFFQTFVAFSEYLNCTYS